jgi:predicted enzyme related to lactoylglutathione lyase
MSRRQGASTSPSTSVTAWAVESWSAAPSALWLPYVSVPEIRTATERAAGLGARILLEPREGPTGWRSAVAAPAGGEIAFWQSKEWTPGRSTRS